MSRSPSFGSLETAAPEPLEDLTDQRGAIDNDHAATCTSPRLATACTDLEKENPLVFSLKAHGLRERIIRFTPSWVCSFIMLCHPCLHQLLVSVQRNNGQCFKQQPSPKLSSSFV